MARERVQTRCDPTTVELIDEHADEIDESKSESVRQLIRAGLAERGYQIAAADGMGAGKLDELTDQLTEIERRQVEMAQRQDARQDLLRSQLLAAGGGIMWVVATLYLNMGQWWWLMLGAVFAIGAFVTTYYATGRDIQ